MIPRNLLIQGALRALERAISTGSLHLICPQDGEIHFAGPLPGPEATMVVRDWRILDAVRARGDIGLGEAYMAGWWDSPDLEPLIALMIVNVGAMGRLAWGSPLERLKSVLRDRFLRRNTISGSRRNILAHYDLGNSFYSLWLDASMSYSSGLYTSADLDLTNAQQAKYQRILDRLGDGRRHVLEIGCGWGGFVEAALREKRRITALTISPQQFAWTRARAGAGAEVRLEDYRQSSGRFDAVVSIEMFEAVGEHYWPVYFRTLRDRMRGDGIALVQTITIAESLFCSYRKSSDYIRHHIFPGGMLPPLSRFRREAERAGLACRDLYSFGADYARTLRDWLKRFDASAREIRALGYDQEFVRGWRLYLAMCAAAFAVGRIDVHQIELVPVKRPVD